LKVISKKTAEAFKETHMGLRTIAEQYKVRYALEGSVAKAGNSLRISAQLIDAMSDTQMWALEIPGILNNVFDMQDKVARAVVDGLKLKLTPAEEGQIARRPITNVQAYDAYLRARSAFMRFTEKDTNVALQFLENSLKLTGDNALVYAGLGHVHYQYANLGVRQEEELMKAEAYAEQALRLDPETAQAYMVLGNVDYTLRGDMRQALRHFKQALSIELNDWDTIMALLAVYYVSGKTAAAWPLVDRLAEIDPLNAWAPIMRGIIQIFCEGRFDSATQLMSHGLSPLLDEPNPRFCLAYALAGSGRYKDAIVVLEPVEPTLGADGFVKGCLFLKFALQGKKEKVQAITSPEYFDAMRRDPGYSLLTADLYAILDEREQALDWLENAVNRGWINYPYLSEYDPFLAKLRGDPRFQELMVRVKGEWERFEI
jgi:non-specific serine/threonine protein kinase